MGFEANQVCRGEVRCGVQEGNAKKLSSVRQLFHYMGRLDPLKGDALNKAVRDTAHEAISAIFSLDDFNKRIQGFGNTNFEMPSDDKKSFLSEVVGIGSATIKQGLSSLTQAQSLKKNESPNLRRSLTNDRVEHQSETQTTSRLNKCVVFDEQVLSLLDGEQIGCRMGHVEKTIKAETTTVQMPDLIDTSSPDYSNRMNIGKTGASDVHMTANGNGTESFDIFWSNTEIPQQEESQRKDVHDLLAGLSIKDNASSTQQKGTAPGKLPETIFSESNTNPTHQVPNNVLNGLLGSQAAGMNANSMFPLGHIAYNIPSGLIFNPVFPTQPVNYGAILPWGLSLLSSNVKLPTAGAPAISKWISQSCFWN
ncbi:ENTH/VHS family protein [Actinidia rufa]|uniref:ENTH/VHS family protein n=1 Tax=Actinidia rufa TaxID=165716 RepID=A0A7J0GBD7_9ERIC|nr:ENTH/VHS family protein [Actinidia rufa]